MSFAHLNMMAETARINKTPKDYQVGVRINVLDRAVAEFTAKMERLSLLEASAASCTCGAHERGFEIDTKRTDARPYLAMEQARIDRLLFEGAV